jgi:hypothetical protein
MKIEMYPLHILQNSYDVLYTKDYNQLCLVYYALDTVVSKDPKKYCKSLLFYKEKDRDNFYKKAKKKINMVKDPTTGFVDKNLVKDDRGYKEYYG